MEITRGYKMWTGRDWSRPSQERGMRCADLSDNYTITFAHMWMHICHQVPITIPPYSPFLNMTDMAHSAFKAGVKRHLALQEWQRSVKDREAPQEAGMNLQEWRCDHLMGVAQANIGEITQEKCSRWYNYCQTYMPRCQARQEIDGWIGDK